MGDQSINEGTSFSSTVGATDEDGDSITYGVSGPTGMTINANTGVILWIPTEAQGGVPNPYSITVTATDEHGASDSTSFKLTVNEVNSIPTLSASGGTGREGEVLSLPVTADDSDIPANSLTFSLVSGPPGLTLNPTGPKTAGLQWTPTEEQGPGQYSAVIKVKDNGVPSLETQQVVSLEVEEVNQPPVIEDDSQVREVLVGQTLSFSAPPATDPDLPPQQLTYSGGGAEGATVDPSGAVTWDTTGVAPGVYSISVSVSDNFGSNPNGASSAMAVGPAGSDSTNIQVKVKSFEIDAGPDQDIQLPSSNIVTLSASVTPGNVPLTSVKWFNGAGTALNGANNSIDLIETAEIDNSECGTGGVKSYTFTVVGCVSGACDEDSMVVRVHFPDTQISVDAGADAVYTLPYSPYSGENTWVGVDISGIVGWTPRACQVSAGWSITRVQSVESGYGDSGDFSGILMGDRMFDVVSFTADSITRRAWIGGATAVHIGIYTLELCARGDGMLVCDQKVITVNPDPAMPGQTPQIAAAPATVVDDASNAGALMGSQPVGSPINVSPGSGSGDGGSSWIPSGGLPLQFGGSVTAGVMAVNHLGGQQINLPSLPPTAKGPPALYYQVAPGKWELVPDQQYENNILNAVVTKYGNYQVFVPVEIPLELGEVYVYPNPLKKDDAPMLHVEAGLADRIKTRIYSVSGNLVFEKALEPSAALVDGKVTYRVPLEANLASGVYTGVVTAEKAGYKPITKKFRFSVTR